MLMTGKQARAQQRQQLYAAAQAVPHPSANSHYLARARTLRSIGTIMLVRSSKACDGRSCGGGGGLVWNQRWQRFLGVKQGGCGLDDSTEREGRDTEPAW
jgi:hypothetical protein